MRLRVSDGRASIVVDLIADSVQRLHRPSTIAVEGREILAESLPDILVNKLCALLGRSEMRDLIDVEALVSRGCDLNAAIVAAPMKDSGFSPLTLAWVLRDFDVAAMAGSVGLTNAEIGRLDAFRARLIERLVS